MLTAFTNRYRAMKRFWTVLLLCAVSSLAWAGGNALAVRKQVELSMLLSGNIVVEKDGTVGSYTVDQREKIPPGVLQLLESHVPKWQFEPVLVDGQPVRARAKMGLRIVAQQAGDDKYNLRIDSSSFGDAEENARKKSVTSPKLDPPHYPQAAARAGVTGTVFLVLKVGRDGTVQDLLVEQVNLTVLGTEGHMRWGRDLLSRAASAAAKKWTFNVPTHGEDVNRESWNIRVPVDFVLSDGPMRSGSEYAKWKAYVPGPRSIAPWIDEAERAANFKPDAMLAGQVYTEGSGLRLLTRPASDVEPL